MRDPKVWIGTSPSEPFWSESGDSLFFQWNPEAHPADSLYTLSVEHSATPVRVPRNRRPGLPINGIYNRTRTLKLYSYQGDLYLYTLATKRYRRLTQTTTAEQSPAFVTDELIAYTLDDNLYTLNTSTGQLRRWTDFRSGQAPKDKKKSEADQWLAKDQQELSQVLRKRTLLRELDEKSRKREAKQPKEYYLDKSRIADFHLTTNLQYVTFLISDMGAPVRTEVPTYVTESGYTEDLRARPKVGNDETVQQLGIYDLVRDTIYLVKPTDLPGIDKLPAYKTEYGLKGDGKPKKVFATRPVWSEDGNRCIVVFRSADNKDRWITSLELKTGTVAVLDYQHDEAWIAGPGIGGSNRFAGNIGWMPDQQSVWFQSEASGYSHLYVADLATKHVRALTSGNFEVSDPQISRDKKRWYFLANREHPGDVHLYTMPIGGGTLQPLTTGRGMRQYVLSPDERRITLTHSYITRPAELFVMDNPLVSRKSAPKQLTFSTRDEFRALQWMEPEVISFAARDSTAVYARLYKPQEPNGAAVVFVHGAGYLQNAHFGWSSYFREFMFHNLLAQRGYTVLDIDYRGSAGYGRDVRTDIYRHMGGKDLTDHVDGVRYLVNTHGVDPTRVGIYGGSYGGFITLMALFKEADTFKSGAALRSVTDWAHYNHPYTSNILNTPAEDSIAYRQSSPIYFAEGLKGNLLMCHGMIDVNVHFQDIVRLTQRFIELGKDNWELAVYPMEDHGFVEPSSWTDEYKRILKLFESTLAGSR